MPKISFLIVTKNRPQILAQTLDSLLVQTNPDWEAIVVDDGDGSEVKELVENYKDSRFKYFVNTGTYGAAGGRNLAAKMATASIVAILDDDDLAYPERVEKTLEVFNNQTVDVVYANLDIWDVENNLVRDRKTPVRNFDLNIFKERDFIPHGTVAMKKDLFLTNLYDSFFLMAEDYDLLSRLAVQGKKFVYIPQKLLKYRLWPGNTTNQQKQDLVDYYTKIVQEKRGWL